MGPTTPATSAHATSNTLTPAVADLPEYTGKVRRMASELDGTLKMHAPEPTPPPKSKFTVHSIKSKLHRTPTPIAKLAPSQVSQEANSIVVPGATPFSSPHSSSPRSATFNLEDSSRGHEKKPPTPPTTRKRVPSLKLNLGQDVGCSSSMPALRTPPSKDEIFEIPDNIVSPRMPETDIVSPRGDVPLREHAGRKTPVKSVNGIESIDLYKREVCQIIRDKLPELKPVPEDAKFVANAYERLVCAYATADTDLVLPDDQNQRNWFKNSFKAPLLLLTKCHHLPDLMATLEKMPTSSAKGIALTALGGKEGVSRLKNICRAIEHSAKKTLKILLKTPLEERSYSWPVTPDEKKMAARFPYNDIETGAIRSLVTTEAAQFAQINIIGLDGKTYTLNNNYGNGLSKEQQIKVIFDFLDRLHLAGYHSDRPTPDLKKAAEMLSRYKETECKEDEDEIVMHAHVLRAIEIGALAPGQDIFKQTSGTYEEQNKCTWPKGEEIIRTIKLLSPTKFMATSTKLCDVQRHDGSSAIKSRLIWDFNWEEEGNIIDANLSCTDVCSTLSAREQRAWKYASDTRLTLTAQAPFDPLIEYLGLKAIASTIVTTPSTQ
ncbi:MAG: hypothetical protein Q8K75_12895 [Chlamydiales bacterium]|nr:hypothetical protein [Chlamydiales bacterium]